MFDDKYTNDNRDYGNGGTGKYEGTGSSSYETYEFSSDYDDYKSDMNESGSFGSGGFNGSKKPHRGPGKWIFAVAAAFIIGAAATAGVSTLRTSTKSAVSSDAMVTDKSTAKAEQDTKAAETETAADTLDSTGDTEAEDSNSDNTSLLNIASNSAVVTTDVTQVVDNVMPSIVSVYNSYTASSSMMGQRYEQEVTSTGSGIIVAKTDDELLIVTNYHVIENADELSVLFIDENTAQASVKGTDSGNDLAVIAVPLSSINSETLDKISIAKLGDSDNLKVGEPAIAIGNALGIGQSVTTGVISAVNREITTDSSTGDKGTFIQTDAAINGGNSGGALVNINGEVIGINSNKIGGSTVEGMGFAIPMSKALPIIQELMQQETKTKVDTDRQGTLGISGASVTSDISSAYGMPEGVYVAQIIDNGGAASSDLQKGDIITKINGASVSSMDELKSQLQYYEAGTTVTLTVQRENGNREYEEVSVDVTLGTQESISSQENQDNNNGYGDGSQEGNFMNPFSFWGN